MEAKNLNEAIKILNSFESVSKNTEIVPIFSALGRILAQDIFSLKSLPAFDNSAMDGYGVRLSDAGGVAKIKANVFAGDKDFVSICDGECVKIMTGARVPQGTQAVVPFEETKEGLDAKESVTLPQNLKENANIRKEGEELKKDSLLFTKGAELDENHLSMLGAQGISHICVKEPLKIGIFAGGNELKEPWESSQAYEIYNSNATMISQNLKKFGFDSRYGGILQDDLQVIKDALDSSFDVIFTSGGASKGKADLIAKALEEIGAEFVIKGINVKPGKPIMVAKKGKKIFVALPGNPLAGAVLLRLLILPFLKRLSGARACYPMPLVVENIEEFSKKNRVDVMLGSCDEKGFLLTQKGKYSSGQLMPLLQSNSLAVFSENCTKIEKNQKIKILPFSTIWSEKETDYIN